jgi:hypothetical protein
LFIYQNSTLAKAFGIKSSVLLFGISWRTDWELEESFGDLMETPWELDGNR